MSGSIYRLIYRSRNVIPQVSPDASMEDVIRAILAGARANNKANNVTGALLFTASGFAQVLEGARDVVERTFEQIIADPRHADVTVLSFTPTEHRSFPDRAMGFGGWTAPGAPDPLVNLPGDITYAGPRATTGSDVLRLLEMLVQREDEGIEA